MNKKTASDILRERYMASQLKKTVLEKKHPILDDIRGIDYIKPEMASKLYNPLFHPGKYSELGAAPPRTLLLRGIGGVGKTFTITCFCQQYQVPLITGFIESARDIKDLFSKSRAVERSVILISNIEGIMEEKGLIHQLNESIKKIDWCCMVVILSRNTVEQIRYDNEVFLKIPTLPARKEILDGMVGELKAQGIDTLQIAQNTPGFVPADLAKLVSMAVTKTLERISGMRGTALGPELTCDGAQYVSMEDFTASIADWKSLERGVTFDDIGALERVKEELSMSILLPSKFPERFAKFGVFKPSGVLLFGPPGCGKTLIAKAVSNMSHCNFLSIKGPELITKYVGDSEKHLRDLFQRAKNLSPCVLFFDEIDSLCGKRGKNEFGNRIVNQILTLLDGMEDRGEVYIIGATNRIESLDAALMRPGRFDKIVEVPLPTPAEAQDIFRKCVVRVPVEPFDFDGLDLTGLSGADIAGVVKEAAVLCLKDNFDEMELKIGECYFRSALNKHRSMRVATKGRRR